MVDTSLTATTTLLRNTRDLRENQARQTEERRNDRTQSQRAAEEQRQATQVSEQRLRTRSQATSATQAVVANPVLRTLDNEALQNRLVQDRADTNAQTQSQQQDVERQSVVQRQQDDARAADVLPPALTLEGRVEGVLQTQIRQESQRIDDAQAFRDYVAAQTRRDEQRDVAAQELTRQRDRFTGEVEQSIVEGRTQSVQRAQDYNNQLSEAQLQADASAESVDADFQYALSQVLTQARTAERQTVNTVELDERNRVRDLAATQVQDRETQDRQAIVQERRTETVTAVSATQQADRLGDLAQRLATNRGDAIAALDQQNANTRATSLQAQASRLVVDQPNPTADQRLSAATRRALADRDRVELPNAVVVGDRAVEDTTRQAAEFRVEVRIEQDRALQSSVTNVLTRDSSAIRELGRLLSAQG